jgi:hypothetical protein
MDKTSSAAQRRFNDVGKNVKNDDRNRDPREMTVKQRLYRSLLVLMLGHSIVFVGYRFTIWHAEKSISRLGGRTVTGSLPAYSRFAYSTETPASIRALAGSPAGKWLWTQWPVIYEVDLRNVSDPEAISEALQIAAGHEYINDLVLYRSAVQDEHLRIIAAAFPKLRSLKMNETSIGDSGIAHLAKHKTLTQLNVQRTAVTNASVPLLATMPRLKELNIAETRITSLDELYRSRPIFRVTTELVTRRNTTDRQRP